MMQYFLTVSHIVSTLPYVVYVLVGTPEIAGLTPIQALEIIRGCRGMNIIGADLVEVSYSHSQSEKKCFEELG